MKGGLVGKAKGGEPASRGQPELAAVPRISTIPHRLVSNQPHTKLWNIQNYWPLNSTFQFLLFREVAYLARKFH